MPFDSGHLPSLWIYTDDDYRAARNGGTWNATKSTVALLPGKKYYWEILEDGTGAYSMHGIADDAWSGAGQYVGQTSTSYGIYSGTGNKITANSFSACGVAWGAGDTVRFAFDPEYDANGGALWIGNADGWFDGDPATSTDPSFTNIPTDTSTFLAWVSCREAYCAAVIGELLEQLVYMVPDGFESIAGVSTAKLETSISLVVSSLVEQSIKFDLPMATAVEQLQLLQISPSRKAERALQFLIDTSVLYERALRLPIIGFMGYEAFQGLRISGALQQLEAYRSFKIEDFDRVYLEVFQRFSIYGRLARLVHNAGVHLFISGSPVPFASGTGGDQGGAYFKSYEFTAPLTDLIRSLPDPDKSVPSAHIAWASEIVTGTGTEIVFDRTIELIFDAITYSRVTDQGSRHTAETVTLRCVSPTAALGYLDGNLGAAPITASWPAWTMASEVLQEIFPGSLAYDLQIDDFPIGQLKVDGLYPNEIIPLIFLRTIIHTTDDGTLIIRNEPGTRGTMTPTHDIGPQDFEKSAIESDDQGQYRPNLIRVSNFQEATSADSLRAPEIAVDEDDPRKAVVYAYPVPWRQVWLRSSHIAHAGHSLTQAGLPETVEAGDGAGEQLEFKNGIANTAYPITGGLISVDYGNNMSLGIVTPAEDGTLTAAISSRSLATVKYKIKRYKFEVADYDEHSLQLWFVDEDDL